MSLVCPWDCTFCCVSAVQVKQENKEIVIADSLETKRISKDDVDLTSPSLQRLQTYSITPNMFDIALQDRQSRGLELTYEQKISLLHNILPFSAQIDFAGGDPLVCYENFLVIQEASKLFGKENLAVTSTGFSLNRYSIEEVASTIGTFDFTFDEPLNSKPTNRPIGYNSSNLRVAQKFSALGVNTRAQLPLHTGNLKNTDINAIYESLHEAEISELLLMRLFPVGRGSDYRSSHLLMTRDDYLAIIEQYKSLESKLKYPKVILQCAMKYLQNIDFPKNPCDLMQNSFGVNSRGKLLLSAWATNLNGDPLDDVFVLGDLAENSFHSLTQTQKFQSYQAMLNSNWGIAKFSRLYFLRIRVLNLYLKKATLYISKYRIKSQMYDLYFTFISNELQEVYLYSIAIIMLK